MIPSAELPHEQGYSLAEQFRAAQNNFDAYFDVEGFLESLEIGIDEEDLSDPKIDGATIWSADHGPVIVVNREGVRTQPWARRMTVAHELCHLLVDRESASELMIVSTPWAPAELERRANAFAAELLLPKSGILRAAADAVRSGWVGEGTRQALMKEFRVGITVCNHQLENRLRIWDGA
jgi:Zn-dependent peptidase ImmA (M78 family)